MTGNNERQDAGSMELSGDRKSVLFVFLASVCFSTGGLFIKLIPWSALAINGARNLIGSAVIGIYLLATKHRLVFSRRVFVGAISMIGVTTLFAVANKLTTAANTIVLQYTAPVFVILFMTVIYRQRPGKVDLLVCFLVLLGVMLFFVDGIRSGNLPGNVLAILSGVCYAGVFMMNTGENADPISSCFLGQLAAGLILTPLCFRETDFSARTLACPAFAWDPERTTRDSVPDYGSGADPESAAGSGVLRGTGHRAFHCRSRHCRMFRARI